LVTDSVLGDLEPTFHPHLADADVVLLGAGEVDEGGAEALRLHHAEIDLDAFAVADGGVRRECTVDAGPWFIPLFARSPARRHLLTP
jgi:hypothetical protein